MVPFPYPAGWVYPCSLTIFDPMSRLPSISELYADQYFQSAAQCELTFSLLRDANQHRLPTFRNSKGELSHNTHPWSASDWALAVMGELGEAANVLKKVRRGDVQIQEVRDSLRQEFADVIIYMDLLAHHCGIDLNSAIIQTFNQKSRQVHSPILLLPKSLQDTGDERLQIWHTW
jgi:NTP pyrophosphatase (non-canonical NTP hydrolase)